MWTPRNKLVSAPGRVERLALPYLAGVGNAREWWVWRPALKVGHLRVGLTDDEAAALTCELVVADAGDSGPERPRTLL